jgi:hypothetical protein
MDSDDEGDGYDGGGGEVEKALPKGENESSLGSSQVPCFLSPFFSLAISLLFCKNQGKHATRAGR